MVKKIIIGLVLVALIGAGVAAHYLFSNLDSLVVSAVEKYGSEATGTTVKLEKATIKIADSEGVLEGLSVGNPRGFSSSDALYVGGIDVSIDPHSITGDGPLVIPEVDVDKPAINYEVNADGKNNLRSLQRSSADTAPKGDASAGGKPARKIIIGDLYIRGGQIQITHPLLKGQPLQADLPTIHLRNVGKATNGATEKEIARQIVAAVTAASMKAATKAAKDVLGGAFMTFAGAAADQAMGMASDAANGVAGSLNDTANGVMGGVMNKIPGFGQ